MQANLQREKNKDLLIDVRVKTKLICLKKIKVIINKNIKRIKKKYI